MSEESEPTPISEIPSNLISEFFVPIFGWIIPGSIFVWMYVGDITLPDNFSHPAFIFFCVAWCVGAVIDIGSHAIALKFFLWGRGLFSPKDAKPKTSDENGREGFFNVYNPEHDYISKLPKDEKRISPN
jgi:hypothetical protein